MHLPPDTLLKKIKKSFGLWLPKSEVSILISADASGLTIRSTDVKTHKIDGSTLKPFSMVQAIKSKQKTYLKVLPYRQWVSINFDQCFYSRLK